MRGIGFLAAVVGVILILAAVAGVVVSIMVPVLRHGPAMVEGLPTSQVAFGATPQVAFGSFVGLGLLLAAILFGAVVFLYRSGSGKGERQQNTDEARMMQELHQGFLNLERRVESLETILLDRASRYEKV
jgi:phage shock protein B